MSVTLDLFCILRASRMLVNIFTYHSIGCIRHFYTRYRVYKTLLDATKGVQDTCRHSIGSIRHSGLQCIWVTGLHSLFFIVI